MVFGHTDYRVYLKEAFSERVQRNKSYSLRAFSKQIGIYPSQLSEIFSNQKHLSLQNGIKVAQKLGLDLEETEYFCLLIQLASAKDQDSKNEITRKMGLINQARPIQNLDLDAFSMIADWYHLPILIMADLPAIQFTPSVIAEKLGISSNEAQDAVDRLLRLELLEKLPDGSFRKCFVDCLFSSEHANLGLRKYHRAMLDRAAEALEEQSNSEKMVGSETFSFDPEQMSEFKKVTEKFFTRAVNLGRQGKKRSEVYHLGVQFFRLTKRSA